MFGRRLERSIPNAGFFPAAAGAGAAATAPRETVILALVRPPLTQVKGDPGLGAVVPVLADAAPVAAERGFAAGATSDDAW